MNQCKAAFLLTLVAATAIPFVNVSAEQVSDSVGFRGYSLGMSIDDFRRARFPDERVAGPQPYCTGDVALDGDRKGPNKWALHIGGVLGEVGAIRCQYFERRKSYGATFWDESPIDVGGVGGWPVKFIFTPKGIDGTTTSQLYQISITFGANYFDRIIAVFANKYGQPQKIMTDTVSNKIGNKFDNKTVVWVSGDSDIEITMISGSINTSSILFYNKKIGALVEREIAKKAKDGASKL